MFATRVLRQAAQHAERHPMIKFVGKSPTLSLPSDFSDASASSFSSYRMLAQQHGPLRKTIRSAEERGVGGSTGHELGPVAAAKGEFFDRNELPARFRRTPISLAEIEAVETGGAALYA